MKNIRLKNKALISMILTNLWKKEKLMTDFSEIAGWIILILPRFLSDILKLVEKRH